MNTPITGVVPHPGVTFPYSEFKGLRRLPNFVRCAMNQSVINLLYIL
ncbi:MAG: hypothetical protein HLUCCA11_02510 [Phormidesmis priestleyi Ana]|uniref:Uncharacterized protein n=1 Tax=Phormidesmis priestleyi Ana TaxID=1666911 RepID=A0A0P8A2W5_9CYAN|nr:MAG: hypothetical protein HLUCCA11_02510 [Phormidesmis priestleyi Ana]